MHATVLPEPSLPSRKQALLFQAKASLLQVRRFLQNVRNPIERQKSGSSLIDAPLVAKVSSEIWTHASAEEFPLTAGKVQNLRVSCAALDGLEFPANSTFSFWQQLGMATRRKGYASGRELREGCLVPTTGGGLCQLSGLLYNVALEAGCEIVERHAHSRLIPGSLAEKGRDATVFWNYVDLRFRASFAFRLEASLSSTHLTIRIRAADGGSDTPADSRESASAGAPVRSSASGDCLTCGIESCFRHPSATASHGPATGHSAFLLDEFWPEFQNWCRGHSEKGDHWLVPIDGHRWNKANYAWTPSDESTVHCATAQTLAHALRARSLPAQGAVRQRALLRRDSQLADRYVRELDVKARHLIVSQNLLPHLWRAGALSGRTFDVLMTRWPIAELQRRLDLAAEEYVQSSTLGDFRTDPELARAEKEALAAAARVVTPHRAIAKHFGSQAILLDWVMPEVELEPAPRDSRKLFFPASPLGRKGIYEVDAALKELEAELLVLGRASEEDPALLADISHRSASVSDLANCAALVLPAWIEHQPRIALRALARGIPVVASSACGLPEHPLLHELEDPDPESLRVALRKLLPEGAQRSTALAGAAKD